MPKPKKTTDITPPSEGVWINEDGQGYITNGPNDSLQTPAERERFLAEWAKWKSENPKLYALGNITPFIGSRFSKKDFDENPDLENQIALTLSLAGDAAIFMPKFLPGNAYKGFKLAKTLRLNPYKIAGEVAGRLDDLNDVRNYYDENEIGITSQPVAEPTHTPKPREARPDFDGVMLPEVTVTADRVRNTIMKWSVYR